jgi:DNA-binding NarL/FixJ family response regulator
VAGCSCLADAARLLESPDGAKRFTGALIELISPDGANGIQVKAELRARGMDAPVIICSDADVLGYEFHGFAGSIRRPCAGEALKSAIELALKTRS